MIQKGEMLELKYDRLTIKEKYAIGTAVAAFVLGWGLTIAGFSVPPLGEIAEGVLFVLGQALLYSASVFGITGYFYAQTQKMKRDIRDFWRTGDERHLHLEEETENEDNSQT